MLGGLEVAKDQSIVLIAKVLIGTNVERRFLKKVLINSKT